LLVYITNDDETESVRRSGLGSRALSAIHFRPRAAAPPV
jgi:hypothetical protein